MKRLVYLICLLLAACSQVNKPGLAGTTGHDDFNPVFPLPTVGASFQSTLSQFLSREHAAERSEYGFQNFVFSGCLGTTAAGLTHTPSSCIAYNANLRGTETQPITYPDNSTTWVAMDENTSGANANLPNFARVAGTHYLIDSVDANQPTMAADSQLLMKVTTAGGAITTVADLRSLTRVVGTPTNQDIDLNSHQLSNVTNLTSDGTGALGGKTALGFNIQGTFHTNHYGVPDSAYHTATGTIPIGSTALALTSGIAFRQNSWLAISQAGPLCGNIYTKLTPATSYSCNVSEPGPVITWGGTDNGTTHSYALIPMDAIGGLGPVGATTTSTHGPTTINGTGSVNTAWAVLTWTPPGGATPLVGVCRDGNLIGVTDTFSFTDVGQPTISDPMLPANPCANLVVTNEALRTRVTAISGTSVTTADAATSTASNVQVVTDDCGMVQAALNATELASYNKLELDPTAFLHCYFGIYGGPNMRHIAIEGNNNLIEAEGIWGAQLYVGDRAFIGDAAQQYAIRNLQILGTGATDATRPAQDGIWLGGTSQSGMFENIVIQSMPHVGFVWDKPGLTGGLATKVKLTNFMVSDTGDACAQVGFNHAIDDVTAHVLFTRNCGANVANLTGNGANPYGSHFAAAYWNVSTPNVGYYDVAGVLNFVQPLEFVNSSAGHIGTLQLENMCVGQTCNGDLFINNSVGLNVAGVHCFDATGGNIYCVQLNNSKGVVMSNIEGDNGSHTKTCELSNENSLVTPDGENILLGNITETGNAATNMICNPGRMIIARSGSIGVSVDPNVADGAVMLKNTGALLGKNAAGNANINLLTTDASNNLKLGDATNGTLILLQNLAPPREAAIASIGTCNAAAEGAHAVATDCNAGCVAGNACTTGAATHCEMYCDGTNWKETGR